MSLQVNTSDGVAMAVGRLVLLFTIAEAVWVQPFPALVTVMV